MASGRAREQVREQNMVVTSQGQQKLSVRRILLRMLHVQLHTAFRALHLHAAKRTVVVASVGTAVRMARRILARLDNMVLATVFSTWVRNDAAVKRQIAVIKMVVLRLQRVTLHRAFHSFFLATKDRATAVTELRGALQVVRQALRRMRHANFTGASARGLWRSWLNRWTATRS